MKVYTEDKGDTIEFGIADFDPKYRPVLKMCFYEDKGTVFTKSYPKEAPHMEKVRRHYLQYGKMMFDQLGYWIPIPWETALDAFCQRIKGQNIDWWLVGSCSACIRGIPLNPHDIDIMIDSKDTEKITELFADVLIEPLINTQGWVTKEFGVVFLHARIDIASDPSERLDQPDPVDCGPYAKHHLEHVQWRGFTIPVPPIELLIHSNRKRGRIDRVQILEEYLFNR